VSTSGGTVTDLATGLSYAGHAVTDGSYVYFVALNGTSLSILKVPVTGGSTTTVVAASNSNSLAVDGTSIYWTSGGNIMKATPK
jgi:hypothetical protein